MQGRKSVSRAAIVDFQFALKLLVDLADAPSYNLPESFVFSGVLRFSVVLYSLLKLAEKLHLYSHIVDADSFVLPYCILKCLLCEFKRCLVAL